MGWLWGSGEIAAGQGRHLRHWSLRQCLLNQIRQLPDYWVVGSSGAFSMGDFFDQEPGIAHGVEPVWKDAFHPRGALKLLPGFDQGFGHLIGTGADFFCPGADQVAGNAGQTAFLVFTGNPLEEELRFFISGINIRTGDGRDPQNFFPCAPVGPCP